MSMRLGSGYFDICFDKRIRVYHIESKNLNVKIWSAPGMHHVVICFFRVIFFIPHMKVFVCKICSQQSYLEQKYSKSPYTSRTPLVTAGIPLVQHICI